MTDDQLQTSLQALQPDGREWLLVNQVIDDRATRRREERNFWLVIGG